MTDFFVLDYRGGARGVPVFVDGVIEEFVASPWNDNVPGSEKHYVDQTPLNFRTKHRLIDFDYCDTHGLFICSQQFLDQLSRARCHYVTRPLQVWQSNQQLAQKRYFLVHISDRFWAMDTERSEYRVNRDPDTGQIKYRKWAPDKRTYRNVFKLLIDESKTEANDLFYCDEANRYIVSDRLAPKLDGLKGVDLTPVDKYVFPLTGEKIIDKGD